MQPKPATDDQVTAMSEQPRLDPLIEYLFRLVRETENSGIARTALAELRRGAGKGPQWPASVYAHVLRYVNPKTGRVGENIALNIATLFALAPVKFDGSERDNMGRVLAKVRDITGSESIERRFRLLLESEPEDLAGHLRQAVSLADSHSVPIGWNRLLWDLRGLNSKDDEKRQRVIRSWARSFWTNTSPVEATTNTGNATD